MDGQVGNIECNAGFYPSESRVVAMKPKTLERAALFLTAGAVTVGIFAVVAGNWAFVGAWPSSSLRRG